MALALDTSTNGGSATGTSHTFAHTCTGNNRILFVGVFTSNDTEADPVTGITYGGVATTRVGVHNPGAGSNYMYMLVNPASGNNNVIISCSSSNTIYGVAASYTGAKQTGQPDASGTNIATGTSVTKSLTTVANNCWTISTGARNRDASVTLSAGAGVTSRQVNSNLIGIGDSNAAITPPGSTSMTWGVSGSTDVTIVMASIAPTDITVDSWIPKTSQPYLDKLSVVGY